MSDSSCTLSPSASAFSAVITALVGSAINGLVSGWLVAFMTGWIAWFALFRVLVGGSYTLYRGVISRWEPEDDESAESQTQDGRSLISAHLESNPNLVHDDEENVHLNDFSTRSNISTPSNVYSQLQTHHQSELDNAYKGNDTFATSQIPNALAVPRLNILHIIWPTRADIRAMKQASRHVRQGGVLYNSGSRRRQQYIQAPSFTASTVIRDPWPLLNREVSVLGWLGWTYNAIFAPITQILWLAANVSSSTNGFAKIVKGLTVAVTALPLCIDCRARYGLFLQQKFGSIWPRYTFDLTNSLSCLLQGVISAVLLIKGAVDAYTSSKDENTGATTFPTPVLAIYPIFSLLWMYGSFAMLPVRDGGRQRAAQKHWMGYFLDVGMGIFAGLFLAAPAFALWQSAAFDENPWGNSSNVAVTGLQDYLECESSAWKRFAAVAP